MRWFSAALIIAVLFALDRAYMDGQNTQQVMSLARWAGAIINHGANDLLRPLRKIAGAG
jgi:hypothetical protein